MINTIIFDFDGVIMDTHAFNKNAIRDVFKRKNTIITDETYNNHFFGNTLREALQKILTKEGKEQEIEEFIALKKEYDKNYTKETRIYEDTLTFIKKYNQEYTMTIATGCRRIHIAMTFEKYSLNDYFSYVITAEDITHGKPNPEIYNKTLQKMNIQPKNTLVIEDSPAGIRAAKIAGMRCIGITNTHDSDELHEADLVVSQLMSPEVEAFLKKG